MSKTKIEWCDYTINPVKGLCPMACSYCYARAMYHRFKWDPGIRFDYGVMDLFELPAASRVFVGSTMELFGEWVKPEWMEKIFRVCADWSGHTFIFLTKRPENLIKWSPFPENCWVGVSVTANGDMTKAYYGLNRIEASTRFISFEPLIGMIGMSDHVNIKEYLNWLIIGQQTPVRKNTMPKVEWIREIVEAADRADIPVFLKDNLKTVFTKDAISQESIPEFAIPAWAGKNHGNVIRTLRQEFPK